MDLGLEGRRAIVCGSSKGLGRACAAELMRAGVSVVINGREAARLETAAEDLRRETGGMAIPVAADLNTEAGREALLNACPAPDILINNNGGPPFADFRSLDRAAMEKGIGMNMLTPIQLVQAVIDGMASRGFGRIVNITSVTVRMPVFGLDLSSGARAGLTAFLSGVAAEFVSPVIVPAVFFAVAGVTAFMTGTSWGTYGIMIPIAMPLAAALGLPPSLVLAAVLGGGVFGDHCSPISDTTIIASLAAGCDHIDHVRTQMPYALVTGGLAVALYLIAGALVA